MFNIAFLNDLRRAESDLVSGDLGEKNRLLEFGAGVGVQARHLAGRGHDVVAVDLADSTYAKMRVFPILEYDGVTLPLDDGSIDVIFSSNVLEHVENLEVISREFSRVLRPGGYCVHVLPSVSWRAWTLASGYPNLVPAFARIVRGLFRSGDRAARLKADVRAAAGCVVPVGHGVAKEAFSELWTFSVPAWRRRFRQTGFSVETVRPLGIFHTGHMLLGPQLSTDARQRLSSVFGSAANVFVVRPQAAWDVVRI